MSDAGDPRPAGTNGSSAMRAILEALFYASSEPVSLEEVKETFGSDRAAEIEQAAQALLADYGAEGRGLMIERVSGGYRIATRPELAEVLREFVKRRNRTRLSRAAIETLSVIAYRQPVTAPEIEAIRGVNPSAILRSLLERRLVRIIGRKKVVGKPFLYGTTPAFLEQFGLNSLQDLPSIEESEGLVELPSPAIGGGGQPPGADCPGDQVNGGGPAADENEEPEGDA